jgi:tetratricopeptide (TPR) repeat protein
MEAFQSDPELADGVRYERGGVFDRARECFESVTRRADAEPAVAAEAWWRLANLHRLQSSWTEALDAARQSAALARTHHLADTEADALNIEGAVWWNRGDFVQARALFNRTLTLAHAAAIRGKALQNLGGLAADERNFDEGERLFGESRDMYRLAGDSRGEAVSLLNIGHLQRERGNLPEARATLEAAATAARQIGDMEMYAAALLNLGIALSELGLRDEAEDFITTAYGHVTIANIPVERVRCLRQLATLRVQRNDWHAARVCLTHAYEVATSAGLSREIRFVEEQLADLPATTG